jgi:uncharacterized membrane protein YbhN (UPF0104 family)
MLGRIGMGWSVITTSAGALVNMVIPLEAGELVKVGLLRRRSSESCVISGLVIWNYIWKLAKPSAIAACFLLSAIVGNAYPSALWLPLSAGVALSFAPYLVLRFLLRHRPAERLTRLFGRIPRLQRRTQGWLASASRLDGEIRGFSQNHSRVFARVLLQTVLARLMGVATLYVMASRLGLPADLGSVVFLYAAQTVADYLAMLLPARIGLGEGTAYLLFQSLGLPPTTALVMVLVVRARSIVVAGLPALWALTSRRPQTVQPTRSLENHSLEAAA